MKEDFPGRFSTRVIREISINRKLLSDYLGVASNKKINPQYEFDENISIYMLLEFCCSSRATLGWVWPAITSRQGLPKCRGTREILR